MVCRSVSVFAVRESAEPAVARDFRCATDRVAGVARDIWDDLPDEMALPACDAKLPTEAGEPANRDNWQTAAQRIADELFERDTANGCRDSLAGYSQRVVEEMKERWRCFNAYLRTNWPLCSAIPMRRFRQISYVGRICVQ